MFKKNKDGASDIVKNKLQQLGFTLKAQGITMITKRNHQEYVSNNTYDKETFIKTMDKVADFLEGMGRGTTFNGGLGKDDKIYLVVDIDTSIKDSKSINDKNWKQVYSEYLKKQPTANNLDSIVKRISKSTIFKVQPMSSSVDSLNRHYKMSNGDIYSARTDGYEVIVNKLTDSKSFKDTDTVKSQNAPYVGKSWKIQKDGKKYIVQTYSNPEKKNLYEIVDMSNMSRLLENAKLEEIKKFVLEKFDVKLTDELIQSSCKEAFGKNMSTEIKSGKDPKQAAAIAYSVQKKNDAHIWGKHVPYEVWLTNNDGKYFMAGAAPTHQEAIKLSSSLQKQFKLSNGKLPNVNIRKDGRQLREVDNNTIKDKLGYMPEFHSGMCFTDLEDIVHNTICYIKKKYPNEENTMEKWLALIGEEFGELCQAINDGEVNNVLEEGSQCIAAIYLMLSDFIIKCVDNN